MVRFMQDKNKWAVLSALSLAGNIGFILAGNVVVALFLGRLLDNWLGTAPWISVAGIILGMISGLWITYKRVAEKKSN